MGLIIEIPGMMSRGKWTAGIYVDERADIYQVKALTKIMTGKAKGTTHLSCRSWWPAFLGVHQKADQLRSRW